MFLWSDKANSQLNKKDEILQKKCEFHYLHFYISDLQFFTEKVWFDYWQLLNSIQRKLSNIILAISS